MVRSVTASLDNTRLAEIPEEIQSSENLSSLDQNDLEETYKLGIPKIMTVMDDSDEILDRSRSRSPIQLQRSKSGGIEMNNTDANVRESVNAATLGEVRNRMHGRLSEPYSHCVRQLNKMDGKKGKDCMQTPMQKMNCITEISSCIK